jgi:hypothetical protein
MTSHITLPDNSVRILVVGTSGVGKTTLIQRLLGQPFVPSNPPMPTPACEIDFFEFEKHVFEFWELSGSIMDRDVANAYLPFQPERGFGDFDSVRKGSVVYHAIFAVFDRTDPSSLDRLERDFLPWCLKSDAFTLKSKPRILFIANKRDMYVEKGDSSIAAQRSWLYVPCTLWQWGDSKGISETRIADVIKRWEADADVSFRVVNVTSTDPSFDLSEARVEIFEFLRGLLGLQKPSVRCKDIKVV